MRQGFATDGALVIAEWLSESEREYLTWPDGVTLNGLPPEPADAVHGQVEWRVGGGGELYDGEGRQLAVLDPAPPAGAYGGHWAEDAGVASLTRRSGDSPEIELVVEMDPDGNVGRVVHGDEVHQPGATLSLVSRIDANLVLVRVTEEPSQLPYILDFSDGSLRQIEGLRREGDRDAYPVGLVLGDHLRVVNSHTCLYVREQPDPDAEILYCYPDGVLLRDRGESRDVDGMTWQAVVTPGGRYGWASTDYLE